MDKTNTNSQEPPLEEPKKKKTSPGRPPITDAEKKVERVVLYLNPEEVAELEERLKTLQVTSGSKSSNIIRLMKKYGVLGKKKDARNF